MSWLHALIQGLWIILPAYIANGGAPVFGGGHRMDFGKEFRGNDLLGGGKTWEGFLFAIASGVFIGLVQILLWPQFNQITTGFGFSTPYMTATLAFVLSLSAMLGDMVASFFKRRAGTERGTSIPLVDQLDFLVFSLPVALVLSDMTYMSAALIVFITPAVHYFFNLLAYYLGIKEVPW
ncbi:MAG: CDP-2,3-bis-(O-geranylgeranyl)-sn-glycerol synthase [Candidatus Aenigmatarchaeota archaeon]